MVLSAAESYHFVAGRGVLPEMGANQNGVKGNSGHVWMRVSLQSRVAIPPLERVSHRELDETRVADRREDSAKGSAGQRLSRDRIARDGHHVIDGRIGEIGVVPNVKEVGGKADLVALIDLKILHQ